MNRPINKSEIKSNKIQNKNLPTNKSPGVDGFTREDTKNNFQLSSLTLQKGRSSGNTTKVKKPASS